MHVFTRMCTLLWLLLLCDNASLLAANHRFYCLESFCTKKHSNYFGLNWGSNLCRLFGLQLLEPEMSWMLQITILQQSGQALSSSVVRLSYEIKQARKTASSRSSAKPNSNCSRYVSYTHFRAHETKVNLLFRLLLVKEKHVLTWVSVFILSFSNRTEPTRPYWL